MAEEIIQSWCDVIPSDLRKEVEREFRHGFNMNRVNAETDAKKYAQFNHSNEAKNIDGVGRLVARIPPDSFYYWAGRLGIECWNDKTFVKEFLKDNPEVAVRNYVKKTVVNGTIFGADGFKI